MPLFSSNYPIHEPDHITLLSTIERTGALTEYTGRGVVIAFIDAGFFAHPDLDDRIIAHVDASTNHVVEQHDGFEPGDLSWHGQMTSVIACGSGRTSAGRYRGIASEAKLVLVKVSTPRGAVRETDILRGLRWLNDTHRRFRIRIVNISVGGDFVSNDPNHPLHRAVRRLNQAGIAVVIAAGNRSYKYLLPPASAPEGIIVGGINDHNSPNIAHWTPYHHNYGQVHDGSRKPDLLAPAVWIASPILPGSSVAREARWLAPMLQADAEARIQELIVSGYADLGLSREAALNADQSVYAQLQQRIYAHKLIDRYHQHVDGTSVAAPIVASVIAQMLEVNSGLTPDQIRAILTATARRLPGISADRQSAGVLNPAEAVRKVMSLS